MSDRVLNMHQLALAKITITSFFRSCRRNFEKTEQQQFRIFRTSQKVKFSIKNFFSKFDQIRSFRWIWSHLLKKFLMENFIFCAMSRKTYCQKIILLIPFEQILDQVIWWQFHLVASYIQAK